MSSYMQPQYLNIEPFNRLPMDVIVNHIMPYTYRSKPKEHLLDIRSFVSDGDLLETISCTEYNPHIVIHDLLQFCNISSIMPMHYIHKNYSNILKRHFRLQNRSSIQIEQIAWVYLEKHKTPTSEQKIKFIWGLLTPIERTRFLNTYIDL